MTTPWQLHCFSPSQNTLNIWAQLGDALLTRCRGHIAECHCNDVLFSMFIPLHPPISTSTIPSLLFEQTQDTAKMSCVFLVSDKNYTGLDGKYVITLYKNNAS